MNKKYNVMIFGYVLKSIEIEAISESEARTKALSEIDFNAGIDDLVDMEIDSIDEMKGGENNG